MTFKAQMALDVDRTFLRVEDFADTITYTPKSNGTDIEDVPAMLYDVIDDLTGKVIARKKYIVISPTHVSQPAAGDTGVVMGLTFRVEEFAGEESGMWVLRCAIGGPPTP